MKTILSFCRTFVIHLVYLRLGSNNDQRETEYEKVFEEILD